MQDGDVGATDSATMAEMQRDMHTCALLMHAVVAQQIHDMQHNTEACKIFAETLNSVLAVSSTFLCCIRSGVHMPRLVSSLV